MPARWRPGVLAPARSPSVPAAVATRIALALWALAPMSSPAHAAPAEAPNLLAGKPVTGSDGVSNAARLTDGQAPDEGAFWLTDVTARLRSPGAHVTWDLGRTETIRCAQLQGDNNDFYHLLGSIDGERFYPIWTATPVDGAGMRHRHGRIVANARWVRLHARGGDGMYSVGELALFERCPDPFPAEPRRVAGEPAVPAARRTLLLFALALGGFILLHDRRDLRRTVLLATVPLVLGVLTVRELAALYPLLNHYDRGEQTFEALLRALTAGLAGLLLYKETFMRRARTPHPRVRNALLGLFALTAIGCYYHFGSAQFFNHAEGRRTHVHTFDQRHYAPMGKYFAELRFDGLYAASFAAYLDLSGKPFDELKDVRFRDLRSSQMRAAGDMKDHIDEVRQRFSAERWAAFKADMRHFVDIMGARDYLGGMVDHGGNATPVWLLGAHALLHDAELSEKNLTLVGFIDPFLVALLFAVVWRTFGFRVAAYVAILFGATDFYMFGTNLMGSILRQDWLVALGLGACAIRRGRPMLGGALIAYGGLIRAFPATAAFFLAAPILWYVVDHLRRERKPPALRDVLRVQRAPVRALAGAALCVGVLVALSSGVFGAREAWASWIQKISIHAKDPSVNNVGLRNVMAFKPSTTGKALIERNLPDPWNEWQVQFDRTLDERRPFYYLFMLAFVAVAVLAARNRRLEQAAMLGLLVIPWVFYPSNYYLHYIFLLPLAVASTSPSETDSRRFGWTVLVLLAVCVGQYFTLAEGWTDLRFTYQSLLALGAFVAIAAPLARENLRELLPPRERGEDAATATGASKDAAAASEAEGPGDRAKAARRPSDEDDDV